MGFLKQQSGYHYCVPEPETKGAVSFKHKYICFRRIPESQAKKFEKDGSCLALSCAAM